MVGDEHVEDAGDPEFDAKGKRVLGGELPSATGSFLELADENSSHFSPENIRKNFKPKHLMAMDMGREAWQARNPGKSAARTAGGATSRRGGEGAGGGRGARRGAERAHAHDRQPSRAPRRRVRIRPGQRSTRGPNATPAHVSGAGGKGAGEVLGRRARSMTISLRRALPHRRLRRRPSRQRRRGAQGGACTGGPRTRLLLLPPRPGARLRQPRHLQGHGRDRPPVPSLQPVPGACCSSSSTTSSTSPVT